MRPGAITRVSALNLAGAALPAILGLLLLPGITRGLGIERFGILALALALLEYAGLLSLGIGPATTKYVAEDLALGTRGARSVVLRATLMQAGLGVLGGLTLLLAAPALARSVFTLSPAVEPETITAFRVVGALLPVTLVLGTLFGALEGARRFGYSNALRVPVAAATFVVPAVMVTRAASLAAILAIVTAVRAVVCVVALAVVLRVVGDNSSSSERTPATFRRLLSFGSWISLSSVLSSILVYGERVMLGAAIGARAVGLYAAPFDTLLRTLIVPSSLVRALFPEVSAAGARGEMKLVWSLFRRGTAALVVLVGPPLIGIALAAPLLLDWWLGPEFARGAGTATSILAIGVLFNALAQVPAGFLIALGRPDIPTKFHVIEVVGYVPLAWWLIGGYGVTGAALAWTARVTVDAGFLFTATQRLLQRGKSRVPVMLS